MQAGLLGGNLEPRKGITADVNKDIVVTVTITVILFLSETS